CGRAGVDRVLPEGRSDAPHFFDFKFEGQRTAAQDERKVGSFVDRSHTGNLSGIGNASVQLRGGDDFAVHDYRHAPAEVAAGEVAEVGLVPVPDFKGDHRSDGGTGLAVVGRAGGADYFTGEGDLLEVAYVERVAPAGPHEAELQLRLLSDQV